MNQTFSTGADCKGARLSNWPLQLTRSVCTAYIWESHGEISKQVEWKTDFKLSLQIRRELLMMHKLFSFNSQLNWGFQAESESHLHFHTFMRGRQFGTDDGWLDSILKIKTVTQTFIFHGGLAKKKVLDNANFQLLRYEWSAFPWLTAWWAPLHMHIGQVTILRQQLIF